MLQAKVVAYASFSFTSSFIGIGGSLTRSDAMPCFRSLFLSRRETIVIEMIAMSSRMHTVVVMVARGITTGWQELSAVAVCLEMALQVATVETWEAEHSNIRNAAQHLVCRVVQSLHTNHMQMCIIEVHLQSSAHGHFNDIPCHMFDMQTQHNSAY